MKQILEVDIIAVQDLTESSSTCGQCRRGCVYHMVQVVLTQGLEPPSSQEPGSGNQILCPCTVSVLCSQCDPQAMGVAPDQGG
jgi:hypothetical protein